MGMEHEKEWRLAYSDVFENLNAKQARFFILFLNSGRIGDSYREAFSRPDMEIKNACILGSRLLKKAKFDLADFLEIMGHDDLKLSNALDKLYNEDANQYLNHIEKIRGLDLKKMELSGSIQLPVINIVTSKDEK